MKKRYEYRKVEINPLKIIKELNELGREGWYPSSITSPHKRGTVLMRELLEEKEEKKPVGDDYLSSLAKHFKEALDNPSLFEEREYLKFFEEQEQEEVKKDAPKQGSLINRMLKDCENFPRETVNRWMKEGKYDLVPEEVSHFRAKQQEDKETISNTIKEAYVRPPSHLTATDKAVLDRFTPAYGKDVVDFCNTEGEVTEVNPPHPTMKDAPRVTSDPILPETLDEDFKEGENINTPTP
jgi:hypothetical protein